MSSSGFSFAQAVGLLLAAIGAGVYRGIPLPGGVPSQSVCFHAELRQVADLAAEAGRVVALVGRLAAGGSWRRCSWWLGCSVLARVAVAVASSVGGRGGLRRRVSR